MNELISIIVPIYNAQDKIRTCIDTLVTQSYKNIEVILIDDGSTDNSGKICDELAVEYSVIKAVHKNNGGVSSARNLGLNIAQGEWIGFVDCDDTVSTMMYERLHEKSVNHGVDFVMCSYRDSSKEYIQQKKEEILPQLEAAKIILDEKGYKGFVWNKLFRNKIIQENKIRFNTTIHMCEDLVFCLEYLRYCEAAYCVGEPLYNYYTEGESASSNKFTAKRSTVIQAYDLLLTFDYLNNVTEVLSILRAKQLKHCLALLNLLRHEDLETQNKYRPEIVKRVKAFNVFDVLQQKIAMKYKMFYLLIKAV